MSILKRQEANSSLIRRCILFIPIVFFVVLCFVSIHPVIGTELPHISQSANVHSSKAIAVPLPTSLLFVGDIMLGRNVENIIESNGFLFPFDSVATLVATHDISIANFEGTVPQTHVKTPSFVMRFSIRDEYLHGLKDIGFDVLSLANNHSYDYGSEGFEHTKKLCKTLSIVCGGSPILLDDTSTEIFDVNGKSIGILFLNAVFDEPNFEALEILLTSLKNKSDIQIVYVHWGEEYALVHNEFQEQLAHALIDFGTDVVIGHHPHVIQDIAIYKNKPIFYSLGNFIFDQYFSEDVQEELGLSIKMTEAKMIISLVPFTSRMMRSQPSLMDYDERQKLFARVFAEIEDTTMVDKKSGIITLE